jgi:hypothetical protein
MYLATARGSGAMGESIQNTAISSRIKPLATFCIDGNASDPFTSREHTAGYYWKRVARDRRATGKSPRALQPPCTCPAAPVLRSSSSTAVGRHADRDSAKVPL